LLHEDAFFFIACGEPVLTADAGVPFLKQTSLHVWPTGPLFFSYPAEILTYSIRAKGMMIWTISTKCLSIFNAYANSVALAQIGWKYYLVYTGTLLVTGTLMYFLIVETKGYTLEEIAVLFDHEHTGLGHIDDSHAGGHDKHDKADAMSFVVAVDDDKTAV
jgi:SP family sugar:H+ symporter-like MFS transporter